MEVRKISDTVSVSPQIAPHHVAEIRRLGFKSIVCNRPDGEAIDQPDYAGIEEAARIEGLEFVFQPVLSNVITDQNAQDFGSIVKSLPAPVLAYCRTGTRCTILWALNEAAEARPVPEIRAQAAAAGYDLTRQIERLMSMQAG